MHCSARDENEKSMRGPRADDLSFFFFSETVIVLYDRPFFSCAHRIRMSVFNPSERAYRKKGATGDEELTQSRTVPGMDGDILESLRKVNILFSSTAEARNRNLFNY